MATAQVVVPPPTHEYLFAVNLTDTLGGPSLLASGGAVVDGEYVFAAGQGLLLADLALATSSYTFEMSFALDAPSGFQKLIDFRNLSSDTGFYALGDSLNFFNVVTANESDVLAGASIHVVLTRDEISRVVSAYVNGELRLSFLDSQELGVIIGPNREVFFFSDDSATGGREAGAGSVAFIRVYNQPLESSQVLHLFQNGPTAVPEPSTMFLLALGCCWWGLMRRRARRG